MGIKKLFQLPLFFYIRDSFYGNIIKKKVHLIYLPSLNVNLSLQQIDFVLILFIF